MYSAISVFNKLPSKYFWG